MISYSLNLLPDEIIYYALQYAEIKSVLAFQSTSTRFYQLFSKEECFIWKNLYSYFFPDSYALLRPEIRYKNIFIKKWKNLTSYDKRHPIVYRFDISFLSSAKYIFFFNSLIYAIYESHIRVYDPKRAFSGHTIDLPQIENLVVHGSQLFTLKKHRIEMRNSTTLELQACFDCTINPETQTSPLAKIIFIVNQHLLAASFYEEPKSWRIKIWDYKKNEELFSLPLTNEQPSALKIKGEFLYVGFENGVIEVVNFKEGLVQVAGTTLSKASIDHLYLSGNLLISRSSQSYTELNIWNSKNDLLVNKSTYQMNDTISVHVHDGLIYSLVLGYVSYIIHVYDPKTQCTHLVNPGVRIVFDDDFPIYDFKFHEGMFFLFVKDQKFKVLDYSENASSCTHL